MVCMELTPLGVISLGVWIGGLPRPSDYVAHVFHDVNYFYGLYIKVVLQQPGVISRHCQMVIRLSYLSVKWTFGVPCR